MEALGVLGIAHEAPAIPDAGLLKRPTLDTEHGQTRDVQPERPLKNLGRRQDVALGIWPHSLARDRVTVLVKGYPQSDLVCGHALEVDHVAAFSLKPELHRLLAHLPELRHPHHLIDIPAVPHHDGVVQLIGIPSAVAAGVRVGALEILFGHVFGDEAVLRVRAGRLV